MDLLFTPISINKTKVKNRIYLTAMHLNMCEENVVSDRLVAFYEERAKGGAGAICVGFVTVDPIGAMGTNIGAHDDKFIPGLAKLAGAINKHGSRSVAQINHQGRYAFSMFIKGQKPIAPSPVASRLTGETPRALEASEIPAIVEQYAQTARRCKEAGFDMVEILCGTGYLISQFLSPLTNKRDDEWGGSEENRHRFGVEVIKAVRRINGPDYPIVVRMNGNDMMENGMRGAELRRFALALEAAGTDAFCINVGWHDAKVPQITMGVPQANFAYMARRMKDELKVPVIASHRINDVEVAWELLADGWCDMVGMGRALIADPYLPQKAMQGKTDEILHCVGCGQGCFDHVFLMKPVECLCNPVAGHEIDGPIGKTKDVKNVAVVGGGVAGMSAALTAARRGHNVTLFEREDFLGGQIILASIPPGREEFGRLAEDLETQLQLEKVNICMSQPVTAEELKKEGFDIVILATGAQPITPPIKGADGTNVIQAWDFLTGMEEVGKNVVIVGGGAVGVETALCIAELGTISAETVKFLVVNKAESFEEIYHLATHGTKKVTIVEMLNKVGKDIGKSTRWTMTLDIDRYGVDVMTGAKVLEINKEGVVVEKKGAQETIPADTVVLAVGSKSYNPLKEKLDKLGVPNIVVGDADKVRLAFDAVHSGHKAALQI